MDFIFVHSEVSADDVELFLGPIEEKDREIIRPLTAGTIEDLMVEIGKFPSKGQARKNGFSGVIKEGYTNFVIGKNTNRVEVWILNKLPNMDGIQ